MTVILYAIPMFFFLIALELWVDRVRGTGFYRVNDAITSLSAGVLSRVMVIAHQLIPVTIYFLIFDAFSLVSLPESWWVWVIAFIAYDFLYYWNHRMGHEMSILWAAHVVHHSSEEYNLTTALRQTSGAIFSWIFYIPMAVAGVPPEMFITIAALNLVYQFWVHTRHIGELGWLEKIFVTPSNHRVHHAQNKVYIDKNYGGVFIIWDRLFNTYMHEVKGLEIIYGIRGALKSFNPVWANCQVYAQLIKDSYHTKGWKNKFRVWFGRTGWRPADVSEQFPIVKTPLQHFVKFDPSQSPLTKLYCAMQHGIMLMITLYLLLALQHIDGVAQFALILAILSSAVMTGFILQGMPKALKLDSLRLIAIAVLLGFMDVAIWLQISIAALHSMSLIIGLLALRKVTHQNEGTDELSDELGSS
ncbi:sterol desaturase family protein [Alteromonas sp. ASW11-130]|uniref:sterol desaturase family protein n=1 Tax=Alteromonas sp. ASW11-130 TaxID=3015775 RepID=UPI0022424C6E|nr:sterol desaturase family protein [Alteromonas sp. ASW11-130]MCW8093373.1 sterol desaturase family protein [Alteromonas sp. ASW11-130]